MKLVKKKEKKMNNLQTYAKFRSKGTPSTPSWATNFAKLVGPKINNYYSINYKNSPKIHLDMACGTGELCDYLQRKEFFCFGVDKDEYAIIEAKEKNCKVDFKCENFFHVKNDRHFTSISAIHDVVNSIYEEEKLLDFLNKCYSLIFENGFLIFDIITPFGFQTWNDTQIQTRSDFLMIQKTIYEEHAKIGFVQLCGFIKESGSEKYNRFDITDRVKNYDIQWIENKLMQIGFKSVELYNSWSNLIDKDELMIDKNTNIFIIAKKY